MHDTTSRQRVSGPVVLVLLVAALALIATSPAETELVEDLSFDLTLTDLQPVEVTLDVSSELFDNEWRDVPMLRLDEVRTVGESGADPTVRLDPAVGTQRRVAWREEPSGAGWTVLPDACPKGCELSFVLSVEPRPGTGDGGRLKGSLTARVDFEEGGFLSPAIPDGARFDLTVHDPRFRPVPQPVLGLAPAERLTRDPDAFAEPTTAVRIDDNAGVLTVTRTAEGYSLVQVDGSDLVATATLEPLSDGPIAAVAPDVLTSAPLLDGCPAWPAPCVRDYIVTGLDGAVTVGARGGARVELGAAGQAILGIEGGVRELADDTATVGPDGPTLLDHRLTVGPDVADSSFPPDADAVATVRVSDVDRRLLVRLGPAERLVDPGVEEVTVGVRLPGAYVDAPGPGDGYAASIPFTVELLDGGQPVEISWQLEVRTSERRLDRLEVDLARVGGGADA